MQPLARIKTPALVGVIASSEELRLAAHMRAPPDLFELRLDCLPRRGAAQISKLRRPLIITARHPAEGGRKIEANRRDLLLKFLPQACFIDVELRSLATLRRVWDEAHRLKVGRICSVHDFTRTPTQAQLQKKFQRAQKSGADLFKLVTRAETIDDLLALLQFLRATPLRVCVMATGKFGPISRLLFPECGSLLIYAPLRAPLYPGQLTLQQLRRYSKRSRELALHPGG